VGATAGTPEELGHDGFRRDATREREAVTAVARDQEVVRAERVHRPDRRGLLPGGEVAVAADQRRLVGPLGLVSKC